MGARYRNHVGAHKPFVPIVVVMCTCPRLGWFIVLATTVAVGAFGRHGAIHYLAQRGVGRSGRESVMVVGRCCRNALVHPNGSVRPGFRGVGTMC